MQVGLWLATQFPPVLNDGMAYLPQLSYKPISALKITQIKRRKTCFVLYSTGVHMPGAKSPWILNCIVTQYLWVITTEYV